MSWRSRLRLDRTGSAVADRGGVAITGVNSGTIVMGGRPVARSAYRLSVQRLAPPDLVDREHELDQLEEFCTTGHDGPYVWWQADAWAGKSALLAWFVLHPPPGIRIVSFFVTARYAGQNDRVAFTDVVGEQLAEILGEPVPDPTDATRDHVFLDLLDRAAIVVAAREERLILVVDGLDEDRGVTVGPEAHSIAALLPAAPAAGMRIVVSGRPNPPLPTDVVPHHPLKDAGVVRRLAGARAASVVRSDMLGELHRLLDGSRLQQDLLGFVAGSGGGLSAGDLSALTGMPEWEVENDLTTVAGRSFTPRPSRWSPETGPDVYVLGHEELQRTALERLGKDQLAEIRDGLQAWAQRYRDHGWPEGTPEYLLRGYFRMAQAAGDRETVLRCATDGHRHDRMLDITGGDGIAIAEVAAAMELFLADRVPDLVIVARIAVHQDILTHRSNNVPLRLPAALARAGQHMRAEALARSIADEELRAAAMGTLGSALIDLGLLDAAEKLAARVTDVDERVPLMARLAGQFTAVNEDQRAEAVLKELRRIVAVETHPDLAASLRLRLLDALVRTGRTDEALAVATDEQPSWRDNALSTITQAVAECRDPNEGVETALGIANPLRRLLAVVLLIRHGAHVPDDLLRWLTDEATADVTDRYAPEKGTVAFASAVLAVDDCESARDVVARIYDRMTTLAERAEFVGSHTDFTFAGVLAEMGAADEAEAFLRSVNPPGRRVNMAVTGARDLIDRGDKAVARRFLTVAESSLPATNDDEGRSDVAEAWALLGEFGRAREVLRSGQSDHDLPDGLAALADAAARVGETDLARSLAAESLATARPSGVAYLPSEVLGDVVSRLAAIGEIGDAAALAELITDAQLRRFAMIDVCLADARVGDAVAIAESSDSGVLKNEALRRLAADLIETKDNIEEALSVLDRCDGTADTARLHRACSTALGEFGEFDRAESVVARIQDPAERARTIGVLAWLAYEAGDVALCRRLTDAAFSGAGSLTDPAARAYACAGVASSLCDMGERERAQELAVAACNALIGLSAEQTGQTLHGDVASALAAVEAYDAAMFVASRSPWEDGYLSILVDLAWQAHEQGQAERARNLALHAAQVAHEDFDTEYDPGLGLVAGLLIAVGLDDEAMKAVGRIEDFTDRARAIEGVAVSLARLSRHREAEAQCTSIPVSQMRCQVSATVAAELMDHPEAAGRLLVDALQIGWSQCLDALSRLRPEAVTAIGVELLRVK